MAVQFWKDKTKKQIDPELFSKIADELAKEINRERQESRDRKNKPTQIRKFYDEVLIFDSRIKAVPADFDALLPYIKMLNAKVSYAVGRDLVTFGFRDFISDSLRQINDKDDFDLFRNFFEAFMGFYKFHAEKEGGAR
jgi:CRISPR-associated protein Csm2